MPVVKKALIIGINYLNSSSELGGCINDALNIKDFLLSHQYFTENEISLMTDYSSESLIPTKNNILKQFKKLVEISNKNKDKVVSLFVSYSGHGSNTRDYHGDEKDKKDEVICPLDYEKEGIIEDDIIRKILIEPLGKNTYLFFLADSCNSGTICDLRYNYKCNPENECDKNKKVRDTVCHCLLISGCKDNQLSMETNASDPQTNIKEAQGAMTASFLSNYADGISSIELINRMRSWLKERKFSQEPQFSSGREMDTHDVIFLSKYNDLDFQTNSRDSNTEYVPADSENPEYETAETEIIEDKPNKKNKCLDCFQLVLGSIVKSRK